MEGIDYIHRTAEAFKELIGPLEEKIRDARAEADHARGLGLDLEGPAGAAEKRAKALELELAHIRSIVERIELGYVYFDRFGFDSAIDACGEWSNWHLLSESPAAGMIVGHDEADVRLSLEAQIAYKRAIDAGLFRRYEVCEAFEIELDEVIGVPTYDLFGVIGLEPKSNDLFLISHW